MRLNKYQKLWIDTLKSGKTRKLKGAMNTTNQCMCCLGVAVKICGLESLPNRKKEGCLENEDLNDFPTTGAAMGIEGEGPIKMDLIKPKWRKKIEGIVSGSTYCLVTLNDNSDMTHQEIGQFIDENRSAVFHG